MTVATEPYDVFVSYSRARAWGSRCLLSKPLGMISLYRPQRELERSENRGLYPSSDYLYRLLSRIDRKLEQIVVLKG